MSLAEDLDAVRVWGSGHVPPKCGNVDFIWADEQRLLAEVPAARTTVIPNAADVDYYRPRPTDPARP